MVIQGSRGRKKGGLRSVHKCCGWTEIRAYLIAHEATKGEDESYNSVADFGVEESGVRC